MDLPTELELVAAARAGDAGALDLLLRRYQPRLWRYARSLCGSAAEAEDALQDALLAVVRGIASYRGDAALGTWLFSILRHACFRQQRRSAKGPGRSNADALDALEEPTIDAAGPEQQASAHELATAVVRAIDELEPAQREALVLRDIEGFSASEVAELTGASVEAVKSRLHRARRNVQQRALEIAEPLLAQPLPAASTSTCPDILQLYSEQLEGDVSPELCERIQEHVDDCVACRSTCDALKRTLAVCRAVPIGPVPAHVQRALERALRPPAAGG